MHEVQRCDLLLRVQRGMRVCECVCLSAGNNREPYEQRLNRSRCRLGLDSGGPKEPYTRGKPGSFQGKAIFVGCPPLRCGLSSKFFAHLLSFLRL